jgi:hypothetical protein
MRQCESCEAVRVVNELDRGATVVHDLSRERSALPCSAAGQSGGMWMLGMGQGRSLLDPRDGIGGRGVLGRASGRLRRAV